ncbi:hypothetical protein U1Q18_008116 [Sarracenia purpurea var. burkii]
MALEVQNQPPQPLEHHPVSGGGGSDIGAVARRQDENCLDFDLVTMGWILEEAGRDDIGQMGGLGKMGM